MGEAVGATRPSSDELPADGRVQRSVRSRKGIIEALVSLVEEGELLPTGEQIAARAGVGQRTVFRHFDDMESLHAEVVRHLEGLVRPTIEEPCTEGSLEERVHACVRARANVFERIAPFEAAGRIQRWHSEPVQRNHDEMVRELRGMLMRSLPELDAAPDAVVQSVELMTSYEAWDRLRTEQGLGKDRAAEVVRSAVMALLGSAEAAKA